jgi:adenosylcobinamide-GDP ribazoletransferase
MREAWGFLTVLGGARVPTPRAWRWFPVVGAVVGALVGLAWWAGAEVLSPLAAAVVAVGADLALTGLLHVDGLADTADGLLPHADPERRLDIMRRADIGAYGVTIVVLVLVARVAGFAARPASIGLVVALWCASRTVVAVAPAYLRYVREQGLASELLVAPTPRWPAVAVIGAAVIGWLAVGIAGIAGVAAVIAGAVAVLFLARARIGGYTGDVLGAAIVVGETVGLLVAGARW